MSRARIAILIIVSAMTALVINSTVGYVAGREPAIFFGPAYVVLIAAWLICATVFVLAERDHRQELRERVNDYRMAVRVTKWRLSDCEDSGSWRWRRPSGD